MDQIHQKRYFQSETEQAVQGLQAFAFYVVNVNSTVVFKHFEDLKDLSILDIFLKQKLVVLPHGLFLSQHCCKTFQTPLRKEP